MSDAGPTRSGGDLAEMVEMLLDKGVVINADVAVTVGDTELLGIHLRAAVASFETAAQYGLQFPEGTDMRRVQEASNRPALDEVEGSALAPTPTGGRPAGGGGDATDDGDADGADSADGDDERDADDEGRTAGEATNDED